MPNTLQVLRRSIQVELGPFVVTTTTTAASDAVSFTCASLVNANAVDGHFKGQWAYLSGLSTGVNLSACRQFANSAGYDKDLGSCTMARAYSTSVAAGIGIEISSRMPAVTDDLGQIGVREVINDTLLSMPPIDLLPVTGVTSQSSYDLTTLYPWLTEKDHIIGIYFQDVGEDYPRPTGMSWEWQYNTDSPRLILPSEPFVTGDTFYIKARRPASSWIKTSGTWGEDTNGLQNDADEALPLLAVVRAQSLATCYRMLGAKQGPAEYSTLYREREAFWTARAYGLRWWTDQRAAEDEYPKVRMRMPAGSRGLYGTSRSYA